MWESLGSSGVKTQSVSFATVATRYAKGSTCSWVQMDTTLVMCSESVQKVKSLLLSILPPPFGELTLPKSRPF